MCLVVFSKNNKPLVEKVLKAAGEFDSIEKIMVTRHLYLNTFTEGVIQELPVTERTTSSFATCVEDSSSNISQREHRYNHGGNI
jgi:hypothetical protein